MVNKVFRINYNVIAVLLGVLVVAIFCFPHFQPQEKSVNVPVKAQPEKEVAVPAAMYHHFLKNPSKLGKYVISPAQFEEDLQFLQKNGYTTVSVQDILNYNQKGKPLPAKPFLITIDDGNESAYEYAFPLLKKYNMKAVINVIGKYTDIFSNPDEKMDINYAHLSWSQLREMQKSGIFEIGNHSYDMHENKDGWMGIQKKKGESIQEYQKALWNDVGRMNDEIEDEIGVTPTVFAYPFGAYSKESVPILKDMGFRVLMTCEEKVNRLSPNTKEPLFIKRFNRDHAYSSYHFFKKMGAVK